ncbi:uncharacterized protein B0I36DRAFT_63612 [Microdochium trichocladiopsis]|uniref:Uncharacterized protein n=1 Tax=Microdochium trichocladiopsis TaxID=1682393 RepID=A0A9P8YE79_9PEZI|nr:uncharacterized protein B0I36DRAFT_63612 [Microdochium trichocladiopsis]KAH7037262.1 hypothetical protein B0I36DRAFT_63612 [Microdochium trichocladiopsis]
MDDDRQTTAPYARTIIPAGSIAVYETDGRRNEEPLQEVCLEIVHVLRVRSQTSSEQDRGHWHCACARVSVSLSCFPLTTRNLTGLPVSRCIAFIRTNTCRSLLTPVTRGNCFPSCFFLWGCSRWMKTHDRAQPAALRASRLMLCTLHASAGR